MKVFAINSSPRKSDESKTAVMLSHLVEGMREAGAEVDVIYLRKKKIENCIGCFTCWTKTPGRCIHNDDMTHELFPKWLEADLAVYATPLYYHTMNGAMSTFRERTLPVVQPFFKSADEKTYHPLRRKVPGAVWLSVCGFPEMSAFDALSDFLNRTRHRETELVAEIYRPSAEAMMNDLFREKAMEILAATKAAGYELVNNRKISPETLAVITQPVLDPKTFALTGNLFWKTCIAEGVTPRQFKEKNMVPRPDSLESFIFLMSLGLSSKAVENRRVVLQFDFSGEVTGACHFIIENNKAEGRAGTGENPDLRIETPFDLWMDVITGKADGQEMFMAGKYRMAGDLSLIELLFQQG